MALLIVIATKQSKKQNMSDIHKYIYILSVMRCDEKFISCKTEQR
jgi:hypothetical protein